MNISLCLTCTVGNTKSELKSATGLKLAVRQKLRGRNNGQIKVCQKLSVAALKSRGEVGLFR